MKNIETETPEQQKQPKELVRIELNLEKWNIFVTKRHKGERILTRTKDGITQEMRIQPFIANGKEHHLLATREGKVLAALFKKWEQAGRPTDKPVYFNFSQIKDILGLTHDSKTQINEIKEALSNLHGVRFICKNIYKSQETNQETGTKIDTSQYYFTILSHLYLFERKEIKKKDKQSYFGFSEFKFHPWILESFMNKNYKPLRIDVINQIKGEVALILYRFLDTILFEQTEYQREIKELAKELDFGAKRFNNLLAQVRKACKELEGKEITTGKIVYCRVEKTVDGRNWKLVVRKGKQEQNELPEPKEQPTDEATQLVNIFLKSFNHDRNPVSKELEQAKDLIDRLGSKKAEFVVDFGIHRVKNDFSGVPQWFGAIILYEKEALEEIERQERELKQQQELSAKIKREEEQKLKNKKVSVFLEYTSLDQVKEVKVAGSFNNWQPEPMARVGNKWSILLELEPGEYQYKFIVDGQWLCDPKNPNRVYSNNTENSYLKVSQIN
jgi:hypothetical protein